MSSLLETIESLNRKERYFLFAHVTGNRDDGLALAPGFLQRLGEALHLEFPIPDDAKGFVDYHMDWLHAAVLMAREPTAGTIHPNTPCVSTGTQEDIDLLVAFERTGVTWLLLVEAKAEASWTNGQVGSKSRRLARIFGNGPIDPVGPVQPRFCLMSPQPPTKLSPQDGEDGAEWPKWMVLPGTMEFPWIELPMPAGRQKLTGCDDTGRNSKDRECWKVEKLRVLSRLGTPQAVGRRLFSLFAAWFPGGATISRPWPEL